MNMGALERGTIGFIALALIVSAVFWIRHSRFRYLNLISATACLTLILIVLGAYVRLSHAGLGCPDWPGCYGNLTPAHAMEEIRAAETVQPGGPVSMAKAWKEMLHRYLAMIVGALIAAITLSAWRNRVKWQQSPLLATCLAGAVIVQAALGALTVTMLLKPAIVTGHLLGGITILALLVWLWQQQSSAGRWTDRIIASDNVRLFGWFALAVCIGQVVLGGWVSTNYAALACSDLPTCHGSWLPAMDFANAFHVLRPLGAGPDGELLTLEALRAIHWTHRIGALVTLVVVVGFAYSLMKLVSGRTPAKFLLAMLGVQILLGLSNVWFSLPTPVAVAHNGVAASLVVLMVLINLRLAKGSS